MKIKTWLVGLLLLSAVARPSEGGEPSDPQSPRIEEAAALAKETAKSAAELSGTLPKPESGEITAEVTLRLNQEFWRLTRNLWRVRRIREDARNFEGSPGGGEEARAEIADSLAQIKAIVDSHPDLGPTVAAAMIALTNARQRAHPDSKMSVDNSSRININREGKSDAPSKRVKEALTLAGETETAAADAVVGVAAPAPGAEPRDDFSPLAKKIRKVRSLAEDAATDGDPGIGSAVVQVKMSLGRTVDILNSLPERVVGPERPLKVFRKAVKEAEKAYDRVATVEVDLKEGRLPAKEDPLSVFGDSTGRPVGTSPAQEVGRGKPAAQN